MAIKAPWFNGVKGPPIYGVGPWPTCMGLLGRREGV